MVRNYTYDMEKKQELMQFRVDSDLKDEFFRAAQLRGDTPSGLLRSLMKQAVIEQEGRVGSLEDWRESINTILLELMSVTQRTAFMSENEMAWNQYRESSLPEYLEDMITYNLEDRGLNGEDYWRAYWKEIDENWFTKFSESPPFISVHQQRKRMDEIRDYLLAVVEESYTDGEGE